MKKKILFIINPISGDIKKAKLPELIERYIDKEQFDYSIAYTQQVGHATHLAKEALAAEMDILVAVGGDGSINEIAKAIVNSKVALAIIPLGSGNGLAYHLELPIKQLKEAIQVINTGKIITIDTIKTNKGEVVSFAGIALEAVAARTYRHLGKRGFLAYAWAVIQSIFVKYKPQMVSFVVDGVEHNEDVYLFTIYNAKYLGYKLAKIEQASLTDGQMDVVIIKTFGMWKILWIAILELLGKVHWAKETEIISAKKLSIHLERKSPMQIDGDSFITSSTFELEINPLSLKVLVPQKLKQY